jgi:hypothetical protein
VVFAREISDPLTSLVKKIDEATAQNSSCNMKSFVVFLSDDEKLKDKLKDVAQKQKIDKCILTIDNPSGPPGYNITKDADVTVVLYTKKNVKVNYAFKKGELKPADVDKIVADVVKILPEKTEKK